MIRKAELSLKKISIAFLRIRGEFWMIVILFFVWRTVLTVIFLLSEKFLPLASTDKFLGGTFSNFKLIPEVFSWANFDGEHYLSISIFGYKLLEQTFFPVYPKLISLINNLLVFPMVHPSTFNLTAKLLSSTLAGLLISNFATILLLLVLYDLLKIDYKKNTVLFTLILILLFPTSFYLGAVYTESLFLLFSLCSFYFARRQRWFLAGFFGALSSATRIFGILILPALIIEAWQQKVSLKKVLGIFIIPLGLLGYMLYQWIYFGDPLLFYKYQTIVGQQHQENLILLPQVYFRYLKMIITTPTGNPIFQVTLLELVVGILFFILPLYGYFKGLRLSYVFYALAAFFLSTLTGSFSSLPRYVIVLFPSFLALALFLESRPKLLQFFILIVCGIVLGIEASLFLRGYWVA